jgi:NADH-quinone oxidoreductase subunit N
MNLTLTSNDFLALSPLLILLGAGLILLLIETFFPHIASKISAGISTLAIILAIYAVLAAPASSNSLLTPWLKFDLLARFFGVFFLLVGLASTFLAEAFFDRFKTSSVGEYYFLLLSTVFGALLIGSANDFLTLFLGIETLSLSLYILCGYMKNWRFSNEASLKYFLMSSLATAFLVYGIALLYGAIGLTNFEALLPAYQKIENSSSKALFLSGAALITLGLAFKAAVVPFHVWAPDVYDGAPTSVTAFMAVGTKAGAFAAFIRVFLQALPDFNVLWNEGIALLAYPTLIFANIVALRQSQLRRFFAYSGISHAGFLLIPLAAGTADSLPSMLFYIVIYALATLGAFAVISFLDNRSQGVVLHDLNGLFQQAPTQAGILSLCILTLAGIPPTAGFFAKLYIFKAAFQAGYHVLVIVGLLTTILSAFYYLRIVSVMFSQKPHEKEVNAYSWGALFVGVVTCLGIVALSVYPQPLLSLLIHISK